MSHDPDKEQATALPDAHAVLESGDIEVFLRDVVTRLNLWLEAEPRVLYGAAGVAVATVTLVVVGVPAGTVFGLLLLGVAVTSGLALYRVYGGSHDPAGADSARDTGARPSPGASSAIPEVGLESEAATRPVASVSPEVLASEDIATAREAIPAPRPEPAPLPSGSAYLSSLPTPVAQTQTKFCFVCGQRIDARTEICLRCGVRQPTGATPQRPAVSSQPEVALSPGGLLVLAGAAVVGLAVFLPWVSITGFSVTSLNGFSYEGYYVHGGVGGLVLVAAAFALLGAVLAFTSNLRRLGALIASGAGIAAVLAALSALGTINDGIQSGYLFSSLSGGSVGIGPYAAAFGGVVCVIGGIVAVTRR